MGGGGHSKQEKKVFLRGFGFLMFVLCFHFQLTRLVFDFSKLLITKKDAVDVYTVRRKMFTLWIERQEFYWAIVQNS